MSHWTFGIRPTMAAMVVGVAVCLAGTTAQAADTPVALDGAAAVDGAKAKALMDSGAKFVDTRVANEYAEGHIAGAISVPYKEKSAKAADADLSPDGFDLSKLPVDKAAAMVMYCNGPECWKSYKGAKQAVKAGYKKVYWFRGGFPEWKARGGGGRIMTVGVPEIV